MWQLLSVFYGVEREKECLKYYQRFDSGAVGQEKEVQPKEPQKNWVFTSFLHLKLLRSKEILINRILIPKAVASRIHSLGRGRVMQGRKGKPGDGRRALKRRHITVRHVQITESCVSRGSAHKQGRRQATKKEDYLQMTGREVGAVPSSRQAPAAASPAQHSRHCVSVPRHPYATDHPRFPGAGHCSLH